MFVFGNLLTAIAQILDVLVTILWWMIIVRALLSWVNPDPYNAIVVMLNRITEPILAPFRRLFPTHSIGIDLSPLLALFALMFVRLFLIKSLMQLGLQLQ